MISTNIKKKIINDLDRLPLKYQERAMKYIHKLLITSTKGKKTDPIEDAMGCMEGSSFTTERFLQMKREEKV